jgi:hypothetical protein
VEQNGDIILIDPVCPASLRFLEEKEEFVRLGRFFSYKEGFG